MLCTYSGGKYTQHKSFIMCDLKHVLFDDYFSIFGWKKKSLNTELYHSLFKHEFLFFSLFSFFLVTMTNIGEKGKIFISCL